MTLILNDDHVAQVLNMKDCVAVLEDAFRALGEGTAVNAPRRDCFMAVARSDAHYSFKTIEGGLEHLGVMAQRINSDLVTYPVKDGVSRRVKVPAAAGNRYVGLVFLYSSENLELLAIITDGHLQRMRVAGSTGVGAKYLAPKEAKTAAIFGSGWQAETAAWALAAVRPLSMIHVYSPNAERCKQFSEKVAHTLGIDVRPFDDPEKAVQGAEIVACASNSSGPVVESKWIESGTHLTCILPMEFDEACWQRSDLIITSGPMGDEGFSSYTTENPCFSSMETMTNQIGVEGERRQRYANKIYLLSDLLCAKTPQRKNDEQITLMNKNWGLGIEFASVAKLVYENASSAGIGHEVPTEWFSQTSHP